MGCADSSLGNTPQNQEIDKVLRAEKKKREGEIRLLMLGAGESGKSTFAKQFLLLHTAFSKEEKERWSHIIRRRTIECMRRLLIASKDLGIGVESQNMEVAKELLEHQDTDELTEKLSEQIAQLWKDSGIQAAYKRKTEFYLPECALYCLDRVKDFAKSDWLPGQEEYVRVRQQTTGVSEITFDFNTKHFRIIDVGGQRAERRKWIGCFTEVTCVLYCIALNEYNMPLFEDPTVNRMAESLKLWADVRKRDALKDVPFVVFFNKSDLLKENLEKGINPSIIFPEYTGGNDYNAALAYIQKAYTVAGGDASKMYLHATCAIDTDCIRVIWKALTDIFLTKNLNNVGF